jgi:hypothetical protein
VAEQLAAAELRDQRALVVEQDLAEVDIFCAHTLGTFGRFFRLSNQ